METMDRMENRVSDYLQNDPEEDMPTIAQLTTEQRKDLLRKQLLDDNDKQILGFGKAKKEKKMKRFDKTVRKKFEKSKLSFQHEIEDEDDEDDDMIGPCIPTDFKVETETKEETKEAGFDMAPPEARSRKLPESTSESLKQVEESNL